MFLFFQPLTNSSNFLIIFMEVQVGKILVTYATNAGSTADVADAIAEEFKKAGREVDVHPIDKIELLDVYDSIVLGAPMIFGWHASARRFLRRNQKQLAGKKLAYFACALKLTDDHMESSIQLAVDPGLVSDPVSAGRFKLKERFTTTRHYLKPMLASAPEIKPVSIAFFNGKLDLRRLKWWQVLFVLVIVQGKPGDYRDWVFIRSWAKTLAAGI